MANDQAARMPKRPRTVRVLMWNVSEHLANVLFDISGLILIVGAVAVAIGTYGSIKMGAAKEYFANERISANEADTERAKADAEIAREGASKANARAASAELALAKFRAPRLLTREQRIQISTRLLAFRGTKFDAGISSSDSEMVTFFSLLGSALKEAQWTLVNWNGGDVGFTLGTGEFLGITPARGVTVQTASGSSEKLSEAARALVSALAIDRKSTRLNSSHSAKSRMPSSA